MAPVAATSSWTDWLSSGLADFAKAAGSTSAAVASAAGAGGDYRFPSPEGLLAVREESWQPYLGGTVTRARCTAGSNKEFDIRRLRLAPAEGAGFVTLGHFEALDREAELAREAGRHPNVLRCFGILTENDQGAHCRLLLNEPCVGTLQRYVEDNRAEGGTLPLEPVWDLGMQLAFGLGHLHGEDILYGGLHPEGVLRGQDGQWKLADFSRSARLPVVLGTWLQQQEGTRLPDAVGTPPEVRRGGCHSSAELAAPADVWFLGHLLADLLLGGCAANSTTRVAGQELAASPVSLEEPVVVRFWLLLHWPLAEAPADRPLPNELASLLSALGLTKPDELLEEMPRRVHRSCRRSIETAARQLAVEQAASEAKSASEHERVVCHFASLSLAEQRQGLLDASLMERFCDSCGMRPWEEKERNAREEDEDGGDVPGSGQGSRGEGSTEAGGSSGGSVGSSSVHSQSSGGSPLRQQARNEWCAAASAPTAPSSGQRRSLHEGQDECRVDGSGAASAAAWSGNPFALDSPFADSLQAHGEEAPPPRFGPAPAQAAPREMEDLIDLGLPDLIDL